MNSDDSKVILMEDGKEVEYYKLFEFETVNPQKKYIAFTDYSKDENGNLKIRANTIRNDGDRFILEPLENEKEWNVVQQVLISTAEKLKEDLAKDQTGDKDE